MLVDYLPGSREQIRGLTERAKIRAEIMSKVAGRTWGAEVGISRLPETVLLCSEAKYGLVTFGSAAYEQEPARLDACHGGSGNAGLPFWLAVAEMLSIHNIYLQQCATTLELVHGIMEVRSRRVFNPA